MLKVKVILKSFLKMKTGLSEVELYLEDGSSMYEVAVKFGEKFGEEVMNYVIDKKTGSVSILFTCNKKMCTKDQIVSDGDVVSIFPALAGG